MTGTIRELTKQDLSQLWEIKSLAHPGEGYSRRYKEDSIGWFGHLMDTMDTLRYYGCFRNDAMLGAMAVLDFDLNLRNVRTKASGVGLVSVDLLHRKEHIAYELMNFFLQHARAIGARVAMLYPFRVDFYQRMGFGYGAMVYHHQVRPESFPGGDKQSLSYLAPADLEEVKACFQRFHNRINGQVNKLSFGFLQAPDGRVVGYRENGQLTGYMVFSFRQSASGKRNEYDLVIEELVYETPMAVRQFFAFLNSLRDQVHRVIITTHEPNLHHLLSDPTSGRFNAYQGESLECATTAVGAMYRVVDVPGLFTDLSEHDFGGQTCRVRLNLSDDLLPDQNRSYMLSLNEGRAMLLTEGDHDVELEMNIASFSSLMLSAISIKEQYQYGLATLSDDAWLDTLNRAFAGSDKPTCTTHF